METNDLNLLLEAIYENTAEQKRTNEMLQVIASNQEQKLAVLKISKDAHLYGTPYGVSEMLTGTGQMDN